MKIKLWQGTPIAIVGLLLMGTAAIAGCTRMSIRERNVTAGFNGGFEIDKNGLPVNWYVHAPPLEKGELTATLDTNEFVEGRQSLRLEVVQPSVGHGWRAPGFFQVIPAQSNRTYRLQFWMRNQGAEAVVMYRSEHPKTSPPMQRTVLGPDETGTNVWREFEFTYTVPAGYDNLRFEMEIPTAGTVWVDNIRIEEIPPP